MKKLVISTGLAILAVGCTSQAIKSGDIVSITERNFGVHVASVSSSTGSPDVMLGFNSTTIQFTPTVTNGTIASPTYANSFKIGQAAVPFTFDVDENIASGNVQIGPATNTVSTPIVPK